MNWGLIAYGRIAKKFIASISTIAEAQLTGIASKTNYQSLITEFPNIQIYKHYQDLYADPNIDIVYISTTHNFHKENVLLALEAGKHVLCEKPLGIHPEEVKEMIHKAQSSNLFLMEAIWTRFLPAYQLMKKTVESGECGQIKLIKGDFSFNGSDIAETSRIKNPDLAAGAIWDVGLYPISMAVDIYNCKPDKVLCSGFLDENGVDIRSTIILEFGKDQQAVLHSGIDLETIHDGQIYGTEQWVHLPDFWHGEHIRIGNFRSNQLHLLPLDLPTSFSYEIKACYEAINNGWIEHPRMTHEHSLIISEIMEESLNQLKDSAKA